MSINIEAWLARDNFKEGKTWLHFTEPKRNGDHFFDSESPKKMSNYCGLRPGQVKKVVITDYDFNY